MTSESIPRRLVEVYSKPGCCLCTQALAAVEAVRLRIPFELVEHDVRQSAELSQRWRYDIPVVCIDGEVAFLGRVTEAAFERALRDGAPAESSPAPGRDETVTASPARHSDDSG
ncbi:MAG: glutaredoxin family protein [Myxococcaceae bacterium]